MATLFVNSAAELEAALDAAASGDIVRLTGAIVPKTFTVSKPLVVPAGVTLEGQGAMAFNRGYPNLLPWPTRRIIAPGGGFKDGDNIVTLRRGARLRRLCITDAEGRKGNLVAVRSTGPGSSVDSAIEECVFVNPNGGGMVPGGPTGRCIVVTTEDGHEGAKLAVVIRNCNIRSARNASGLFAMNFAARARTYVHLERNSITGNVDAVGGVGRTNIATLPAGTAAPPLVDSRLTILSRDNLYASAPGAAGAVPGGWYLHGGANAPAELFTPSLTARNRLVFSSSGDRVEGFDVGLHGGGGSRPLATSLRGPPGPVSDNELDIALQGTVFVSNRADFRLFGARAGIDAAPPGDGNRVRVALSGVTGSGPRDNLYLHAGGPNMEPLSGEAGGNGNRIEFQGSPASFLLATTDIEPPPDPDFF